MRGWEARSVFDTAKYLHRPLPFRWLRLHLRGNLLCFRLDEFLKARRSLASKRSESPVRKDILIICAVCVRLAGCSRTDTISKSMGGQEAIQRFHVPAQKVIRRIIQDVRPRQPALAVRHAQSDVASRPHATSDGLQEGRRRGLML